jgi:conjugative relaxase-like TrwC/TraI family protein
MSLVKLAPDGWRYFAEEIATGREDYYARSAERPGMFLGRGAERLGIAGQEVDAVMLERLIGEGRHPIDGSALGRPFPDRAGVIAGFGLTFSPPKTVSVLWGTADIATSESVIAAHERAVETSLAFLQDNAAFTRMGAGGVFQVDSEGFVAAGFTHRTSRAADPQLHTHVLVANKVRAADGRWRSLDARELFEHQKAAGMLYKAALRAELTTILGVRWSEVDENGIAEIEGVPQVLVEAWSSRRKAVEEMGSRLVAEREADLGRELSPSERATAYQFAAYRTRAPKIEADTPTAELTARWREEARAWGQEPEQWLPGVLGHEPPQSMIDPDAVVRATIERLQSTKATWGRSDAVEVLSTLVTGEHADDVRSLVDELAEVVLRNDAVCSLAAPLPAEMPDALRRRDGMTQIERHGATRFTTKATLRAEGRVLETVASGIDAKAAVVPSRTVDAVLARSTLGEDQRRAVTDLLIGGKRVALLVGPAGAGKSRALEVAREGWERAGYHVIGIAPSAMAASVLHEEAGIASDTLARFLLEVENGKRGLTNRDVVVLDEATMARTDDLDALLGEVTRGKSKLVLVGDPEQLGAVGPGGLFRMLVGDHGAAELETVRRFHNAWEAAASLRLRERDVSVVDLYAEHDRIGGGSQHAAMEDAFAAWRDARARGCSVLVMAGDNETAEAFGLRARADRVASGEVDEHGTRLANGVAGIGDEIVTLKNDRRLVQAPGEFVRNGARWRVVARHDDGSLAAEAMTGRGKVTLPAAYVFEHVALAYALTVHKAQGQTVDVGIALVDERMTSQQLYVAMSRGREENRAFVIQSQGELSEHAFANFANPTPHQVLAEVIRRDGAERSAHDVLRQNLEEMDDLDLLRHLHADARRRIDDQAGQDRAKEIERLAAKADFTKARVELEAADDHLRAAKARREHAEQQIDALTAWPARALLPSRLGEDDRSETAEATHRSEAELRGARREEQAALRDAERARYAVYEAESARGEIERLREAQHQRATWLESHLDEERYLVQLEARIAAVDGTKRRREDEQDHPHNPPEHPGDHPERRTPPERASEDPAPRLPFGGEHPEEPRRSPAEQAVIDRTPRRRLEKKLAEEEARVNPLGWRSAAELERRAAQIENGLTATLHQLDQNSEHVDEARRADEAASDARAIAHARDEAAWHRAAAARSQNQGEQLIGQARADYFAAREAAAVIEAGPGRLRLRAGAVTDARIRLDEIKTRWPGRRLPDAYSSDQVIRDAAEKAALASVEPEARAHVAAADQFEQQAGRIEQQMQQRERSYDVKERRAVASVTERVEARHRAEAAHDELAGEWRHREELAVEMTPEEVAEADRSREELLERQAAARHDFLVRDQIRGIAHHLAPHIERGPVIDFAR